MGSRLALILPVGTFGVVLGLRQGGKVSLLLPQPIRRKLLRTAPVQTAETEKQDDEMKVTGTTGVRPAFVLPQKN